MCAKLQVTVVKSFGDFCQVYYHNLYFVCWSPISDFSSVFDSRKILMYCTLTYLSVHAHGVKDTSDKSLCVVSLPESICVCLQIR